MSGNSIVISLSNLRPLIGGAFMSAFAIAMLTAVTGCEYEGDNTSAHHESSSEWRQHQHLIEKNKEVAATREPETEMVVRGGERHVYEAEPPIPGTYRLPPIKAAGNGHVLTSKGRNTRLHKVYDNEIILLSFIFTTCSDSKGCPLATGMLYKVYQEARQDPQLANKVRLVSLSFNPEHDTPEVMDTYSKIADRGNSIWKFLTTESEQHISPILEAYDQSLIKEYDSDGKFTGNFSHILRVYLIDNEQRIRNIYTSSYLYPEVILADIRTLLIEQYDGMSSSSIITKKN